MLDIFSSLQYKSNVIFICIIMPWSIVGDSGNVVSMGLRFAMCLWLSSFYKRVHRTTGGSSVAMATIFLVFYAWLSWWVFWMSDDVTEIVGFSNT